MSRKSSMQKMKDKALKEAKDKAYKNARNVLIIPGIIFIGTFFVQNGRTGLFFSGIAYMIFYIICLRASKNSNISRMMYANIMRKNIFKVMEQPEFENLSEAERSRLLANLAYYNNMVNRFSRKSSKSPL